jgi:hypothetical protein
MIEWKKYLIDGFYWYLCSKCMCVVPEMYTENGSARQIHEEFHDKIDAASRLAGTLNVIG